MSAEAQAALNAFVGAVAYHTGINNQLWIWDGERSRYYSTSKQMKESSQSGHTLWRIEQLIAVSRCGWERVPVPDWFVGHDRFE